MKTNKNMWFSEVDYYLKHKQIKIDLTDERYDPLYFYPVAMIYDYFDKDTGSDTTYDNDPIMVQINLFRSYFDKVSHRTYEYFRKYGEATNNQEWMTTHHAGLSFGMTFKSGCGSWGGIATDIEYNVLNQTYTRTLGKLSWFKGPDMPIFYLRGGFRYTVEVTNMQNLNFVYGLYGINQKGYAYRVKESLDESLDLIHTDEGQEYYAYTHNPIHMKDITNQTFGKYSLKDSVLQLQAPSKVWGFNELGEDHVGDYIWHSQFELNGVGN